MNLNRPAMPTLALLLSGVTILFAMPRENGESARSGAGGTIEGRIFFKGTPPEPERIRVTEDPQICGSSQMSQEFVVSPENKGLKNAVIFVQGVGEIPEATEINIEQKGCVYGPHVQVATLGATLVLTNNDPTLHNVHGYLVGDDESKRTVFNIAQPASRDPARPMTSRRVLRRPGVYQIECDVHSWMLSYVIVHDNQFYATSDESGHFVIPDIPAGTYTVRIWHEGLGMSERSVTVSEGQSVTLDLPIEAN